MDDAKIRPPCRLQNRNHLTDCQKLKKVDLITSGTRPHLPNFVQIRPRGVGHLGKGVKYDEYCLVLYTCT